MTEAAKIELQRLQERIAELERELQFARVREAEIISRQQPAQQDDVAA